MSKLRRRKSLHVYQNLSAPLKVSLCYCLVCLVTLYTNLLYATVFTEFSWALIMSFLPPCCIICIMCFSASKSFCCVHRGKYFFRPLLFRISLFLQTCWAPDNKPIHKDLKQVWIPWLAFQNKSTDTDTRVSQEEYYRIYVLSSRTDK